MAAPAAEGKRTAARLSFARQHVKIEPYPLAEPEGVNCVVPISVFGLGMHEDLEALSVEHQKRNQT